MLRKRKISVSYCITLLITFSFNLLNPKEVKADYQDCITSFQNQQYEKAYAECLEYADLGDSQAESIIGLTYMMGNGVDQNIPKAIEYLKKSANQGHAQAAYALGAIYTTGEMIPPDYEEGLIWVKMGAFNGSFEAKVLLSNYYLMGWGGLEKNPKLAFLYMKNAADSGRVPSMAKLAEFYEKGIGTPVDKEKALTLYQRASQAGYQPATDYLNSAQGRISLQGDGQNQATPLPPMGVTVQRGAEALNPPPPEFTNEFKVIHDRPLSENKEVIEHLKANVRNLETPYIFELSRRLGYEDMDEAIVWFKVAYMRAVVDAFKCTDSTARQGVRAWPMMVPNVIQAIRENPQRDKDALQEALEIEATFPDDSSPLWICMHGMQAIGASIRGEEIKDWHFPKSEWARIRKETIEAFVKNNPQ